jgi:hypothetical protein
MFNPVIRFKRSLSEDVTGYAVTWEKNGELVGEFIIPRVSGSDNDYNGYIRRLHDDFPAVQVLDGDTIVATIAAVDTSGLESELAVLTLAIPQAPPEPVRDASIALS